MRQMKTKNYVRVIEIDGDEVENKEIVVENHWNRDALIVLVIDGKRITVNFLELHKAMQNSVNTSV